MADYQSRGTDELIDLLLSGGDRVEFDLIEAVVARGAEALPRLRKLLLDEELWYEGQGDRFWAEFHVVTVLGMIADAAALPDLLTMLPHSYFAGQEWVSNWWGEHLSGFGPAAIDPLRGFIADTRGLWRDNPDYSDARIDAARALAVIAHEHPAERERVLGLLQSLFDDPAEDDSGLLTATAWQMLYLDHQRAGRAIDSAARRGAIDRREAPTQRDLSRRPAQREIDRNFRRDLAAFYTPQAIARRQRIWQSRDITAELERLNLDDPFIPVVSPVPVPLELSYPAAPAPTPAAAAKVGRNDPCHCGSGKKFKKCCGTAN